MNVTLLWINISFMAVFFALWTGIPLWMTFKRPDQDPRFTRTVPAYLRQRTAAAGPARRPMPARAEAERREPALVGRS